MHSLQDQDFLVIAAETAAAAVAVVESQQEQVYESY
jgi:hypothetical protein